MVITLDMFALILLCLGAGSFKNCHGVRVIGQHHIREFV